MHHTIIVLFLALAGCGSDYVFPSTIEGDVSGLAFGYRKNPAKLSRPFSGLPKLSNLDDFHGSELDSIVLFAALGTPVNVPVPHVFLTRHPLQVFDAVVVSRAIKVSSVMIRRLRPHKGFQHHLMDCFRDSSAELVQKNAMVSLGYSRFQQIRILTRLAFVNQRSHSTNIRHFIVPLIANSRFPNFVFHGAKYTAKTA